MPHDDLGYVGSMDDIVRIAQSALMNDGTIQRRMHAYACHAVGISPTTFIGGPDERDPKRLFLDEDDPRYDQYWAHTSVFMANVCKNMHAEFDKAPKPQDAEDVARMLADLDAL